jgi:hypothetical protein
VLLHHLLLLAQLLELLHLQVTKPLRFCVGGPCALLRDRLLHQCWLLPPLLLPQPQLLRQQWVQHQQQRWQGQPQLALLLWLRWLCGRALQVLSCCWRLLL